MATQLEELTRIQELQQDFDNSQAAVLKAMERVDAVYNVGGLSVDDYYSIMEVLRHAEI